MAIVAFSVSLAFVFPAIFISKKLKLIDTPSSEPHKVHKHAVPLAGGIILFFSLVVLNLIFGDQWPRFQSPYVYAGISILFFLGALDDRFRLSPGLKLIGQIASSGLILAAGFQVYSFNAMWLNQFITLFWLVGIINAFNFLDGADGLMLEVAMTIILALIIFTQISSQPQIQAPSIILFGILGALLLFNIHPAKIFMGDSGAQVIGLILALLIMEYNPQGHDRASSWITPIIMMSIPIFDVCLVVFSRLRKKVHIYKSGLDHTFHRLVKLGLSTTQATYVEVGAALLTNIIALLVLYSTRSIAYLLFALSVMTGWGLILLFEYRLNNKP